jgi:hypothetical protein
MSENLNKIERRHNGAPRDLKNLMENLMMLLNLFWKLDGTQMFWWMSQSKYCFYRIVLVYECQDMESLEILNFS